MNALHEEKGCLRERIILDAEHLSPPGSRRPGAAETLSPSGRLSVPLGLVEVLGKPHARSYAHWAPTWEVSGVILAKALSYHLPTIVCRHKHLTPCSSRRRGRRMRSCGNCVIKAVLYTAVTAPILDDLGLLAALEWQSHDASPSSSPHARAQLDMPRAYLPRSVRLPAVSFARSVYVPLPDQVKLRKRPDCDSPNAPALRSPARTDASTLA